MLILRFFFWVQVYHWTTFYKQNPIAFILGVLLFPYHLITRLSWHPSFHAEMVANAIQDSKEYWKYPGAIQPPQWVKRKFLSLEQEVLKL